MAEISLLALTAVGIVIAVLGVFILTRKIESAIFWALLLGPAIGGSLINAIIQLAGGDFDLVITNLSLSPFVIAPLDQAFFSPEVGDLAIVGLVILFLWIYVLAHWLTKWKGVWGIPILPAIIFALGLTLPNLRTRIAQLIPQLSFLAEPFLGLGLLVLVSLPLFLFAYMLWRRDYSVEVPMTKRLGLR